MERLSPQDYYRKAQEFIRLNDQTGVGSLVVEGPQEEPLSEPLLARQVICFFKEKIEGEERPLIISNGFKNKEDSTEAFKKISEIDIADRMERLQQMNPDIDLEELGKVEEAEKFLRINGYPIGVLVRGVTGAREISASLLFYNPNLPISQVLDFVRLASRGYLETNKE